MKDSGSNQNLDWRTEAGPLKVYLTDPAVTEIMVNRWDKVFIEKKGVIEEATYKFPNADSLMRFAQSIAVVTKKELNHRHPYLDARLPDGSRVNIIIPPVALEGPSITIRKFSQSVMTYQNLIQSGTVNDKVVYFLSQAVQTKQNIIISGGTGSGKTTILNVLTSFISPKERVVTIEDTAELQINVKNIVRLETRDQIGTEEAITVYELQKNALRMRPDRIIIGECRGDEAYDMLVAMNTGHEGSMTTLHANSSIDALRRLESMIIKSGKDNTRSMIQEDIANSIDIVIQAERGVDGKRRITEITEICGRNERGYDIKQIFIYDANQGLISTGEIPDFVLNPKVIKPQFPANFFEPDFKIKLSA